jgi:hypothetical protein
MPDPSASETTSEAGPPGAAGHVLAELPRYGQLVVHTHTRTRMSEAAVVDGETIALDLKSPATELSAAGQRGIVCEWLPGPAFGEDTIIEVSVAVTSTSGWSLELAGELADVEVATFASCDLRVDVLGTRKSFDATRRIADRPPSRIHTGETRANSFVARDSDTVGSGKTLTKNFEASAEARVATGPAVEGLSYAAGISFATAWSFSVAVLREQTKTVAQPARETDPWRGGRDAFRPGSVWIERCVGRGVRVGG